MISSFMNSSFLNSAFLNSAFLNSAFLNSAFLNSAFLNSIFLNSTFMNNFVNSAFFNSLMTNNTFLNSDFYNNPILENAFLNSGLSQNLQSAFKVYIAFALAIYSTYAAYIAYITFTVLYMSFVTLYTAFFIIYCAFVTVYMAYIVVAFAAYCLLTLYLTLGDLQPNGVIIFHLQQIIQMMKKNPQWFSNNNQITWNVARVLNGHSIASQSQTTNHAINVAILDTGINATNPELAGQVKWAYDATGHNNPYDSNGHGTSIANVLAALPAGNGLTGVDSNVNIYSVKVLDGQNGSGTWNWFAKGIYAAVAGPDGIVGTVDDANIISMSFDSLGEVPPQSVANAVQYAYNHGVVLVAAAGNEGTGHHTSVITYPAAYPQVIAVGATGFDNHLLYYSNVGNYIELVAPGNMIPTIFPNDSYGFGSGTSYAVPQVVGIIALIMAQYGHLPIGNLNSHGYNTIRGILNSWAYDLGSHGYDPNYGYGLVQFDG